MATVTTTLKLDDRMSGKLVKVVENLEKTDKATNKNKKSALTFAVVAGNAMTALINKTTELVTSIPRIGDAYTLTQARLRLITQEGESVAQVNDKIFQSAQRAKASYIDTANAVSKLGLLAGEAFANTDEIIAFSELMNKSFKIGGASIEEQTAGMYQLTQAMAAGKLQGDEFRSIMENAPMLAQAIADFTDKSKGELKEMSSQGLITADVIKGALFSASDDINAKFEEIPQTWGSTMQSLENQFYMAFGGIAGYIGSEFAGMISSAVTFIVNNLDVIIAYGTGIGIIISAILIPKIYQMAVATWTAVTGWALMHAPIVIVAGAVVALLLLFLKFPEVFGMIAGGAYAVGTAILNFFKWIANSIISVVNLGISALNKLPGVNISTVDTFEYKSEAQAYSQGYEWGTSKAQSAKTGLENIKNTFSGTGSMGNYSMPSTQGLGSGGLGGAVGDIGKGVKGLNDKLSGKGKLQSAGDVKIEDDNLKYLLDLASIKQQKTYQKAPVYVNVSTGDINTRTDEAKLLRKLEDSIINAYNDNLVVV